jgi:hypothetical protein
VPIFDPPPTFGVAGGEGALEHSTLMKSKCEY